MISATDAVEPTTVTTLTGALITMVGLLVSLFNVQLGNWLSKLQGLRTKWDMNFSTTDEKERAARREVRYSLAEIFNFQPGLMTLIIGGFAGGVIAFFHIFRTTSNVVFPDGFLILYYSFFGIMISLQLFLVIYGYIVGCRLKKDIDKTRTAPPAGAPSTPA